MTEPQATPRKTLDSQGDLCPVPVIKTSRAIKEVGLGEVLEVLATDPASKPDMAAWSRMTGHTLLASEERAGPPRVFRFLIRRTK